jgi:hypothetical protein
LRILTELEGKKKKNIVSGFSIFSILTPFVDVNEALDFGGRVKKHFGHVWTNEQTNKPGEQKPKDLLSSQGGGGIVGRFYLFSKR